MVTRWLRRRDWFSVVIGAFVVVTGGLACVGASGRWVSVSLSLLGATTSFSGVNSHLDGYPAIAIAVAGIIAGLAVAVTTRRSLVQLVDLALVAVLGTAGLALMLYEDRHLHHVNAVVGLVGPTYLDVAGIHSSADWGLRLCGVAFGLMALTAVLGLLLDGSPMVRSAAQPSVPAEAS
jgi:hypothetical protein